MILHCGVLDVETHKLEFSFIKQVGDVVEFVVHKKRVWDFIDAPLWLPMLRSINNSIRNNIEGNAGDWDNTTARVKKSVLGSLCS